jgi:Protein of unknown function (DUF2867)
MRRRTTLKASSRSSELSVRAADAWAALASGRRGERWYVVAAPFVVRGAIDRVLGGAGRRWHPPGRPLLVTGDTAGFWRVVDADDDLRRLVLRAEVRAPGRVLLTSCVTPSGRSSCVLRQTVSFEPAGLLGAAYLMADLPAREVVMELAHRRAIAEVLGDR